MKPERDRENSNDHRYLEFLDSFAAELSHDIDALFIAGDIANKARYEEYSHFDEVIFDLLKKFGIQSNRVFFTPGNHDVDWAVLDGYDDTTKIDPNRWKSRYNPLRQSQILSDRLSTASGNLVEEPYYCVWQTDDLLVVSANSASFDSPDFENHPGIISRKVLAGIRDDLKKLDPLPPGIVKVFMLHHHPLNYENLFPGWKDFSILQCEDDFIEFCHEVGFDLILHGHRHQPKFRSELSQSGSQIAVICSGSFSYEFPSYVYGDLSNLMHIIKIEGRDSTTGVLCGELNSYRFSVRHGWTPSESKRDGIDGTISFGPNQHFNQVLGSLEPNFTALGEGDACELLSIVNQNGAIKHVERSLLFRAAKILAEKHDLTVLGSSVETCVILRQKRPV